MSTAAFTIRAFGDSLRVLGIALVAVPGLPLGPFLMRATNEVWIRVVGLRVFDIGIDDLYAAKCEAQEFFRASIWTRTLVLGGFAVFARVGLAKPLLVGFGLVEFLGGLWTRHALKGAA